MAKKRIQVYYCDIEDCDFWFQKIKPYKDDDLRWSDQMEKGIEERHGHVCEICSRHVCPWHMNSYGVADDHRNWLGNVPMVRAICTVCKNKMLDLISSGVFQIAVADLIRGPLEEQKRLAAVTTTMLNLKEAIRARKKQYAESKELGLLDD